MKNCWIDVRQQSLTQLYSIWGVTFYSHVIDWIIDKEKFEDTKRVINQSTESTESRANQKPKGNQKPQRRTDNTMAKIKRDKQSSTKHYTENWATRTPLKTGGWTWVLWKSEQFLRPQWHLSCYSCYKPCDVINERKPDCDDDKLNISMVICDTDIMKQLTKSWWRPKDFQ
jgi:hypothetical protein